MKQKILIIDDDKSACLLLEKVLKSHDFLTATAHNGQEGLDTLKAHLPDLIILDVMMPVMDGYEFLVLVKNNPSYSQIPIIMLTVAKERSKMEKGITFKADFYLPKPFDVNNLINFITTSLKSSSSTVDRSHSIEKNIHGIGKIEFKFVSNRNELEQACCLIYNEYETRGLIQSKNYKTPCRVFLYHALPDTRTIVALKDGQVVGTTTIIPDSALGLPMDQGYKIETDHIRKSSKKFFEIGYLAISSALFPRGYFSLFNFAKLSFMFGMFKFVFQYPLYEAGFENICIVTDPKLMIFKFIPFKEIGPVKHYGFDYSSIKKKPAVLKILNLPKLEKDMRIHRIALKKLILDNKIPSKALKQSYRMTLDDLHYFLVKKSDVLKNATKDDQDHIRNIYNLTDQDFNNLLK